MTVQRASATPLARRKVRISQGPMLELGEYPLTRTLRRKPHHQRKETSMKTSLIRPGIMVSLKTTVRGGVQYARKDLEEGETVSRWETTRVIDDPIEHEKASKARSKARVTISKVCCNTAFGLLCPEEREAELDAACVEAQRIVADFNASSTFCKIAVYVLPGRVASTSEQAARAIGEEVRSLIEAMGEGIDKLSPEAIREAALKAKQVSAMLGAEQQEKVAEAIEQARKAARVITKRIAEKGESAAIVLADVQRGAIERARLAFCDFEAPTLPAPEEALPAVNVARFSFDDDDAPAAVETGEAVQ